MGLYLTFEIDGQKISRELSVVADGVKSYKQPLNAIGSDLMKTFDMNFNSRGALYGGWKARKGSYPWPLLEKTGHMRHAFAKHTTDDYVSLTNDASYFKYHQSSRPRSSGLPRRVMMTLRRQDATMIVKEMQSYIISVLRSRGLR